MKDIPVGTLGGGREPLNWLPEFDSAAIELLDASSVFCLFSYKANFDCVPRGIVLVWTVDLQGKNRKFIYHIQSEQLAKKPPMQAAMKVRMQNVGVSQCLIKL